MALLSTFGARGNKGLEPFGALGMVIVFIWLAWRCGDQNTPETARVT